MCDPTSCKPFEGSSLSEMDLQMQSSAQVVVAQAEFVAEEDLVPQATSIVTFLQLLGSSIGLA